MCSPATAIAHLDPQEAELYRIEIHPKSLIRWQGMKPTNSLHFSPSGITFVSNGTFTLCSQNNDEALGVIINRQGRIRTEESCKAAKSEQPLTPPILPAVLQGLS